MVYNKVHQPKLSDVIEQQLEHLILEGKLRVGDKLPPERELAKQFGVSRPSLREAIQRLEAKGLVTRKQGGGTYVRSELWQSLNDPLPELLSSYPEAQFDLLEARYALEGISAYYAALRGTDNDFQHIQSCYQRILTTQQTGDIDARTQAVMEYQLSVTQASHNVVLIHLLRSMSPILQSNVKHNFELLYSRREELEKVNNHRDEIYQAIMSRNPEQAREASHRHLSFIEEVLLDLTRVHSRTIGVKSVSDVSNKR